MIGAAMHSPVRKFAVTAAAVLLGATAACGDDGDADSETTGETRRAELQVLEEWTGILPDAGGTAEITTDEQSTIELTVEGLQPDTEYPAHVHAGTCEDTPPGGEHWDSDPESDPGEPTHVHTYVVTDAEGRGTMADESDLVVDDRALSVVVHAAGANEQLQEAGADRILCGDLEPR